MRPSGARWIVVLALAGAVTAGAGVAASAWLGGGGSDSLAGAEAAVPGTGAGWPAPEVRFIRIAPPRWPEAGGLPAPARDPFDGMYDHDDDWGYHEHGDEHGEEHGEDYDDEHEAERDD